MEYEDRGFIVHRCPMEEDNIPSLVQCAQLVGDLQKTLLAGRKAVIQSEMVEMALCYLFMHFFVCLQLYGWIRTNMLE